MLPGEIVFSSLHPTASSSFLPQNLRDLHRFPPLPRINARWFLDARVFSPARVDLVVVAGCGTGASGVRHMYAKRKAHSRSPYADCNSIWWRCLFVFFFKKNRCIFHFSAFLLKTCWSIHFKKTPYFLACPNNNFLEKFYGILFWRFS